jgi:hypothetical protein
MGQPPLQLLRAAGALAQLELEFADRTYVIATDAATDEWDLRALREPVAPAIRRQEELVPVDIRRTAGDRNVVDFGQVLTALLSRRPPACSETCR